MSARRGDRFVSDIVRSRQGRQRRRRQRSLERARYDMLGIQEGTINLVDQVKSSSKELGLLGLEVGKGAAREFMSLGADFLITFSTLGLAEPASIRNRRRRRRR